MKEKDLKVGKRYWWEGCNYGGHTYSGLFTGKFDPNNGNAILMQTRRSAEWSIPAESLRGKR